MKYKKSITKPKAACSTAAEFMRYNREARGLSIYELGKISGVSKVTIGNWERGANSPMLSALEIVADTLGISIDEYVGHEVKA